MTIRYEEDVALAWAELLRTCADEHGAPNFAWHMAEAGCTAANARLAARRWRDDAFEPAAFAGELELFADELERLTGESGPSFPTPGAPSLPEPPAHLADAWARHQRGDTVEGHELSRLDEWRADCAQAAGF